ncbi:MAG: hypothetical protein IMF11_19705, partial [Proteobacteria bacterium]|nr:hypothetical protein [Pseudomonadota bacterium]
MSDFEEYNSLKNSKRLFDFLMSRWENKSPQNVKYVLSRTRFALVDILFPDDDANKDKPRGIAVIRGLQRLILDLPTKKASKKHSGKLLDIVALSRADDMDKIQAALQAGACGYVLKSRPLAFPAVIGELESSIQKSIINIRRNFRLLYNLPNETIHLLRTVHIPSLPFHNPRSENSEGRQREKTLPMARLLAAFPKADLHVHVGSCMSPEFLVISSLVMLVRHKSRSPEFEKLQNAISYLVKFWERKDVDFEIIHELQVDQEILPTILYFDDSMSSISNLANQVRNHLKYQIDYYKETHLCTTAKWELRQKVQERYQTFRSILHKDFGIPDHIDEEHLKKHLDEKFDVSMFQFAMTHSVPSGGRTCERPLITDKEDVLRIFLLFLANKYEKGILQLSSVTNFLLWFRQSESKINGEEWEKLHSFFWSDDNNPISYEGFRRNNWALIKPNDFLVNIELPGDKKSGKFWPLHYVSKENPIAWQIATGTRCSNLKTYLEGCEFSGAEHLRHPYLIHLYAQQTVHEFVRQGVMYAELRAAVSGYENSEKHFTFQDACDCMRRAFQQAQYAVLERYNNSDDSDSAADKPIWLWKSPFAIESLFQNCKTELMGPRFPVKVSIILTGKRHKATRQMLQEAASATVLHTLPSSRVKTAGEFVDGDMGKCRLVGFDLAGQEDDYPPQLFRNEFEQISKMHIPITVHAGENAPVGFVESAVLDLRARRIGHGLALAEDSQLMNRLREDGVCVELCPVSNFQTNQFVPADGKSPGREYPLRAFLK